MAKQRGSKTSSARKSPSQKVNTSESKVKRQKSSPSKTGKISRKTDTSVKKRRTSSSPKSRAPKAGGESEYDRQRDPDSQSLSRNWSQNQQTNKQRTTKEIENIGYQAGYGQKKVVKDFEGVGEEREEKKDTDEEFEAAHPARKPSRGTRSNLSESPRGKRVKKEPK